MSDTAGLILTAVVVVLIVVDAGVLGALMLAQQLFGRRR